MCAGTHLVGWPAKKTFRNMFNLGQMVIMVHLHTLAGDLGGLGGHLPARGSLSSHPEHLKPGPANLKPGNVHHRPDGAGPEKNALNKNMDFLDTLFWNLSQ